MTERKNKRLPREILGLLILSFFIALLLLLQILMMSAAAIAENYMFRTGGTMTDFQYEQMDSWVFNISFLISVLFFIVLFLFLLGERLSYIHEISKGISALQNGIEDHVVPLTGKNELTELAKAVNYLSETQREVKRKERTLSEEKDQFIRALSHDIRTPLTSVISYSELLANNPETEPEELERQLMLIHSKAIQMKHLTDILLDGSKRNPERFENIRILMEQLVGEFEEMLEDDFSVESGIECPAVSGTFDVQELRRIFDNMISNIRKYADPDHAVKLHISLENDRIVIKQENSVKKPDHTEDGYRIGIRSIQRIAQNYGGEVTVTNDGDVFCIGIAISKG